MMQTNRSIKVGWRRRFHRAGWVVPDGNVSRSYFLSNEKLSTVPRSLRNPEVFTRFQELFSELDGVQLRQWWNRTCSKIGDKTFLLDFPSGAWDIPWELLISPEFLGSDLSIQSTICLARTVGQAVPEAPSIFDEPLRTLVLQGARAGPNLAELDLDQEAQSILSAWEALEFSVKSWLEKPVVQEITRTRLPTALQEHRPHIIWFSGHGDVRRERKVRLLFADNSWIDAKKLAALIKESKHCPLYAVFWACDTGRADERETTPYPPSLFEQLRKVGVLSVLAMQSPIRDASVIFMAQDLFRRLAMGLPLEMAMARVRVYLRENRPRGAHPMDWASPVIWSSGIPVDRFQWNDKSQTITQFQVLGRYALAWNQARPQQLDAPLSSDEKERATDWIQRPRTWIRGNISEGGHRNYWIRTLQAIQLQTERFVLSVELRPNATAEALREWAESIYRRMLPGDFPEEIARILSEIADSTDVVGGWRRLCHLNGVYMAIANPPDYQSDSSEWFWQPLLAVTDHVQVALLTNQAILEAVLEDGWEIDIVEAWEAARITGVSNANAIETAIDTAPRLARALATLNMPLWEDLLEIPGEEKDEAHSLLAWPESENVMINTAAGPTMSASARNYVLMETNATQLQQAHSDCVYILGHEDLVLTTPIREHRLDHLLASESYWNVALEEAKILCHIYRETDRPAAVLKVFERLEDLYLPAECLLIVAWAYLQLGYVEKAYDWLPEDDLADPLDIAWRHCLRAEIYKSAGTLFSPEKALEEVEAAIQVCQEAEKCDDRQNLIRRRTRAYRQDRARILQFLFHDSKKAAQEFQSLVKEWRDEPGIDLAIVQRNYAECLRYLATGQDDPQWRKASNLLQKAESWARDYPYATALTEILYEKAKLAEAENRVTDANRLLEKCIESARTSRHYMLAAIAENRLFWNSEPFSIERWHEIEKTLSQFSYHGWAVRTLINSRLRATRILMEAEDWPGGLIQLEANLADLNRNSALDRARGDRLRVAKTMAGLQIIGEKMEVHTTIWKDFIKTYPWAQEWLQERANRSPEDIWREVG